MSPPEKVNCSVTIQLAEEDLRGKPAKKAKLLTQGQIAKLFGIVLSTYNAFRKAVGARTPGLRQLLAMAVAVGIMMGLATLATRIGAAYWLMGLYGALMGAAFVNYRFWEVRRLRFMSSGNRVEFTHARCGLAVSFTHAAGEIENANIEVRSYSE